MSVMETPVRRQHWRRREAQQSDSARMPYHECDVRYRRAPPATLRCIEGAKSVVEKQFVGIGSSSSAEVLLFC